MKDVFEDEQLEQSLMLKYFNRCNDKRMADLKWRKRTIKKIEIRVEKREH